MTAAAPVPDPGTVIYLKDWLTLIALVIGPVLAVLVTFWHDTRREKQAAKHRLFLTLMAHRQSAPIHQEWAQALNIIDVVFADHPKVLTRWHTFYDCVNTPPLNAAKLTHLKLDLLAEMARSLGYGNLQQTDIDKYYAPQGLTTQTGRQAEVMDELLRVLKHSSSFAGERTDEQIAQETKK